MVQSNTIAKRGGSWIQWICAGSLLALLMAWTWATRDADITIPQAVALEERLKGPVMVAITASLAIFVIWTFVILADPVRRRRDAARGDALARVTDQPGATRAQGRDYSTLTAIFLSTFWASLLMRAAPEAVQVALAGEGFRPLVAGIATAAFVALAAYTLFTAVRRVIGLIRSALP